MGADRIEIQLPPDMVMALRDLAEEQDASVGHVVRLMIAAQLRRTRPVRPPIKADETLVAPLRARLAADLAHGGSWADIQHRLNAKGYVLREAGGGLALHRHPSGERVCKASELGFSYSQLMRRLRAPFPGHAHVRAYHQVAAEPSSGPTEEDNDDDIILIEPF